MRGCLPHHSIKVITITDILCFICSPKTPHLLAIIMKWGLIQWHVVSSYLNITLCLLIKFGLEVSLFFLITMFKTLGNIYMYISITIYNIKDHNITYALSYTISRAVVVQGVIYSSAKPLFIVLFFNLYFNLGLYIWSNIILNS